MREWISVLSSGGVDCVRLLGNRAYPTADTLVMQSWIDIMRNESEAVLLYFKILPLHPRKTTGNLFYQYNVGQCTLSNAGLYVITRCFRR
jgi:hypothetical protein